MLLEKVKLPLAEIVELFAPLFCSVTLPDSPDMFPPICLCGSGVGVGVGRATQRVVTFVFALPVTLRSHRLDFINATWFGPRYVRFLGGGPNLPATRLEHLTVT